MIRFPRFLAALAFLCGQVACSQSITAENVDAVVAERLALGEQTRLVIDGKDHTINKVALLPTDDGLELKMQGRTVVFGTDVEALEAGDDDISSLSAFAVLPQENGRRYVGELPIVDISDEGLVTISGTLNARNQTPLQVTAVFSEAGMSAGNAKIEVLNDRFVLSGILGFAAYDTVKSAIANHPDIKLLELTRAPGSVDDDVNVYTARLVRNAGITTFVANGSRISSGAVDLFAAGVERLIEPGAQLGVHSWCCSEDGTPVADLAKDDPAHTAQLSYFTEMLGPVNGRNFYFYTLNAAPSDDIYWMPIKDMQTFNLITGLR